VNYMKRGPSIVRTQHDIILSQIFYLSKSLHHFRCKRRIGFPGRVLHESDENFEFGCVNNIKN